MNAPASPSEVTVPADGRGGSGREPLQPNRLREARSVGLQPFPGCGRSRLAESSWCMESAGEARGPGAAWRFAGRAAWFCQTASSSPPPAPELPPDPDRGELVAIVPAARGGGERTWGTAAPGSFVASRLLGAPVTASPEPRGCGEGSCLGSWASEAVLLGRALGVRPPQPWVGSSHLQERPLSFGGPSSALLSQSNRVLREEILTWKRGGDWKAIRARGRLLRA